MEVDLSKPLIFKFRFGHRIKKLEYKGLHMVCFSCGKYRNKQEYYLDSAQDKEDLTLELVGAHIAKENSVPIEEARLELFSDYGS